MGRDGTVARGEGTCLGDELPDSRWDVWSWLVDKQRSAWLSWLERDRQDGVRRKGGRAEGTWRGWEARGWEVEEGEGAGEACGELRALLLVGMLRGCEGLPGRLWRPWTGREGKGGGGE